MDVEAAKSAARHRHHPIIKTLGSASDLADQIPLGAVCASVMAVGLAAARPDILHMGTRMMAAHILANVVKRRIKNRLRRIRPEEIVRNRDYRFETGESEGGHDTSFPSGHTAGAVAVARIASRDMPRLAVPAMGLAAMVAAVQIPRAKHYPVDVLAGAALGVASAWLVDRLLPGAHQHDFHAQENSMSDDATKSISATFETRETADRAIEHLVQQHGVNRADIFAEPVGDRNTAGNRPSGGDAAKADAPSQPALEGAVKVSADVSQDRASVVEDTFRELGGQNLALR